MKNFITLLAIITLPIYGSAQSFTVTVTNGYGSGTFNAGDTVHIWAKELKQDTVFTYWSGDTTLLNYPNEWHQLFIMPNKNVSFTANFDTLIPSATLQSENIQGADTIKPVLYYFPQNPIGVVFLFHGTAGNMNIWVEGADNRQITKDLMYNNFAVVITEAEEITRNTDIDKSGVLRWITGSADPKFITESNNIDIQNISALIDTFETRGLMPVGINKFAIGMSNGASFSGTVSRALGFKAATPYCAPGILEVYANTSTATQWCMAKFDDNPNVGIQGYYNAQSLSDLLDSLGVCTQTTYLNDRSPIYPEVFMRTNYLSLQQSEAIYNELGNSGFFDTLNVYTYMNIYSDTLFNHIVNFNSSSTYPVLYALKTGDPTVLGAVRGVMDVTHAGHKFYAEHNKRTIDFLLHHCDTPLGVNYPYSKESSVRVYPNPTTDKINFYLPQNTLIKTVEVYNLLGENIKPRINTHSISLGGFKNGIYVLKITDEKGNVVTQKIIKN